jgi:hypothetical protein
MKSGIFHNLRIALQKGDAATVAAIGQQFFFADGVYRLGDTALNTRGERVFNAGVDGGALVALGRTPENSRHSTCRRWLTAAELRRMDPSRLDAGQRALYFEAIGAADPCWCVGVCMCRR